MSACSATVFAPWTTLDAAAPRTRAPESARSTTSGCSSASSASKSPPREAARKASSTSFCRPRSGSAEGVAPRTRRRARLAELPGRGRAALHDRRDVVERHGEHVVQHEREPLGGLQVLQDDEQGQAHRVGLKHLLRRVDMRQGPEHRVRDEGVAHGLLAACGARAQEVEADAAGHRGEPAAEVLDVVRVGAAQPQPGFLDGVLRLGQRSQHAVRDRSEVPAVFLEPVGQFLAARHTLPRRPSVRRPSSHLLNSSKATAGLPPNRSPVASACRVRKPRTYVSGSWSVSTSM